jgi:hypothetical protein
MTGRCNVEVVDVAVMSHPASNILRCVLFVRCAALAATAAVPGLPPAAAGSHEPRAVDGTPSSRHTRPTSTFRRPPTSATSTSGMSRGSPLVVDVSTVSRVPAAEVDTVPAAAASPGGNTTWVAGRGATKTDATGAPSPPPPPPPTSPSGGSMAWRLQPTAQPRAMYSARDGRSLWVCGACRRILNVRTADNFPRTTPATFCTPYMRWLVLPLLLAGLAGPGFGVAGGDAGPVIDAGAGHGPDANPGGPDGGLQWCVSAVCLKSAWLPSRTAHTCAQRTLFLRLPGACHAAS